MNDIIKNINVLLSATVEDNKILYHDVSIEEVRKLFHADYSASFINYKNNYRIYRGDTLAPLENISIATPGIRKSENTINIYTTLMSDILSSWSEYPKRNRSFICSTNKDKAFNYIYNTSYIFNVFPRNNAKIGICPENDIWGSFKSICDNYASMAVFNKMLDNIIRIFYDIDAPKLYKKCPINFTYNNKDEILRVLEVVNNNIIDVKSSYYDIYNSYIKDVYNSYLNDTSSVSYYKASPNFILDKINEKTSLLDVLSELLNSNINKFKLVNINNFDINGDHEVWTDSECIMIPEHLMSKVLEGV